LGCGDVDVVFAGDNARQAGRPIALVVERQAGGDLGLTEVGDLLRDVDELHGGVLRLNRFDGRWYGGDKGGACYCDSCGRVGAKG
jgi:hypothetical protein